MFAIFAHSDDGDNVSPMVTFGDIIYILLTRFFLEKMGFLAIRVEPSYNNIKL